MNFLPYGLKGNSDLLGRAKVQKEMEDRGRRADERVARSAAETRESETPFPSVQRVG